MNQLPPPMVDAEVNLKDFPYMPLEVARLRDSGLAAQQDPAECWFAVLLWCASWHQDPAGSLPNDDMQLSAFAGFGRVVKEWRKVKTAAMRGWILCQDGRWYHPVVSEKANEAWLARLKHQWKLECDRIRQHNRRHNDNLEQPTFEAWNEARRVVNIHVTDPMRHADGNLLSTGQDTSVTRTDPTNQPENSVKGSEVKGRDIKHSGGRFQSHGAVDNPTTPLGDKSPQRQKRLAPVQWWKTDQGIELKAKELGIPHASHTYGTLKDLCFARIKAIAEGKAA